MRKNFDLSAIRARLAETTGRKYWRSLDELAETEEFKDFLEHEFPQGADQWLNPVGRRNFLKLMAASLALGGLAACSPTRSEKILPYVRAPEEVTPGKPLFFATATQLRGIATGELAESHLGRPTKIEGNPEHPGSLGATDTFMQASVLNLWDPDRSQLVNNAGLISTWSAFVSTLTVELQKQGLKKGAGLRILTETVTSPALAGQLQALLEQLPEARWHQYEPVNRDNARQGAIIAFGQDVNTVYRFDRADRVLALEADFMAAGPIGVRYARDFSNKRRVRADQTEMNRLYMVESSPSVTGSLADHRLPLRPSQMVSLTLALAAELGLEVGSAADVALQGLPEDWIPALARDLQAHRGASMVIAGDSQPPLVHALAHAINEALGNVGQTVIYTDPLEAEPVDQMQSLGELVDDMAAGQVDLLVIIDANPVYTAPVDLNFAEAMQQVNLRIRMGLYEDETSALCQWHIPATHYLEAWGDGRAYDGAISLTQPLIEPLYDDKSAYHLLAAMLGQSGLTDYDVVHDHWVKQSSAADPEQLWKESLYQGFMADTALPPRVVAVDLASIRSAVETIPAAGSLEITFRPDPALWDGRFANNGWLQELPKPLSKLTWDNPAFVSPATAEQLGLSNQDVVEIHHDGRTLWLPVWIMPGQANDTITLSLGYGRSRAGRVGNGVGFNTYTLRTSAVPWSGTGVEVRPTPDRYRLASTQSHFRMQGREFVRVGTIEHYKEEPDFAHHMVHEPPEISLFAGYEYDSYAWGMVVDLNVCSGCNACVTACQAENNIPIVGKEQVLNGREMHWIRIDGYFEGELDNPQPLHQPVMCQHCEQAPCEVVCPVNATVHDHEGLNVMVYNRCIGTRYCSNNCPYKVRRFNFLQYTDETLESLKGQRNPDVTVRVRGVMEKCSYCVQRISAARIQAKNENRPIGDGEVVTACQAACPTGAIVFGNINDPDSRVAQLKAQPQNYGILSGLGTHPRTTYLAKLTNPNPELAPSEVASAHDKE